MDDNRTELEKAKAQVAGLERFLRSRLLNALTRLLLVLVLVGGLVSASLPGSHFLESASFFLVVGAACATWLIVRYFHFVRSLRSDPLHEVARLQKNRKVRNAGFVDTPQSSGGPPLVQEHSYSEAPETDTYGAPRDVDVFGQKSDGGVNRTDDPSRGPIE